MIDMLIYLVGYEQRSGYIAGNDKMEVGSRIGLVLRTHQKCWFDRNYSAAQNRNDRLIEIDDGEETLFKALGETIGDLRFRRETPSRIKVGIDVSSMARELMSCLFRYLFENMDADNLHLIILYATAKYQEPPADAGPYVEFRPIQGLEGWTKHPERPLSSVLGLGYEADQAIGTVEYLDPSGIWAFIPNGEDARFRRDLNRANNALWPILEVSHRLEYRISNPYHLYTELRGLVETLAQRSRVILVPGGPKIFSALSLLVKLEVGDEVSVWRASTHGFREIRDVEPSGAITRFDYPKQRRVWDADQITGDLVV
jgi:hypothetical protein